MVKVKTVGCSAEFLIGEIRSGTVYSYARYGDGEFRSILGWRGNNAGEHDWTPELQDDLTLALTSNPKYRVATVTRFIGMMYHRIPGDLDTYVSAWKWLAANGIDPEWYDQEVWADSLIQATSEEKVAPLLQFLREAKCPRIIVVGPSYLGALSNLFPVSKHVITSPTNCHATKRDVEARIISAIRDLSEPILCLMSASMAAEVLIDDLYPTLGARNWLIDIGSIWDPYLGVKHSRTYWEAMGNPIV